MTWPEDKKENDWDGLERRKHAQQDHDLLIEIHTNTKNMLENFKSHVAMDFKQFEEVNRSIRVFEKWVWGCAGGLAVLQVILNFLN